MKKAFTIAEILITLGIIGIVAAMTIPGLINNYKAHKLHSKFLKSYSTIQQVIRSMVNDEISTDPSDYDNYSFPVEFAKYLNAPTICYTRGGNKAEIPTGCMVYGTDDDYKFLNSTSSLSYGVYNNGEIILQDGTLLLFDDAGGTNKSESWNGTLIIVDLNGYNRGPNMLGYDAFAFENVDGDVYTMGDLNTDYNGTYLDADTYCDFDKKITYNGLTCAHKAKSSSDYFKQLVSKIK